MENCTLICLDLHLNLLCYQQCVVFALKRGIDERKENGEDVVLMAYPGEEEM